MFYLARIVVYFALFFFFFDVRRTHNSYEMSCCAIELRDPSTIFNKY